jgi:hypothetical protein
MYTANSLERISAQYIFNSSPTISDNSLPKRNNRKKTKEQFVLLRVDIVVEELLNNL